MNILHISKYYYPFMGGVENICKYLVEQMPGHRTSVVCFNEEETDEVDEVGGHQVYRSGALVTVARQAVSTTYGKVLKEAIERERPDVIQVHWANPYPLLFLPWLLPKGVKVVVHWHMDIVRQWYLYWAVKPWEKWLVRRADRIVVTSPQYREGSKPLQKVKDKVRVVPNCIEEQNMQLQEGDRERIEELRAMYGGRKIVFFMGRHSKYKGLPWLVEAEKWLKEDCAIVIAGKGELTDGLKKKVERDGQKRIHFVGRLSDQDLRCYLHAASVFAFPSITKNEAFGVALAEAMYCGVPAVTFTIPGSGVNWVNLNGVTGIEVPNSDSKAYASALDKLLADDALREKYGKAARERVENNFLLHHMVEAMEEVYREL